MRALLESVVSKVPLSTASLSNCCMAVAAYSAVKYPRFEAVAGLASLEIA